MNWTIFSSIFTALGTLATFIATGIALWIACTEYSRQDKYKRKIIKSQKCDLILIPTKEWDSGANYQKLLGELTGLNRCIEAAKYANENSSLAGFYRENPSVKRVTEQAEHMVDNSISKKLFLDDKIIFISPSELFWIGSERIYGVNIKPNVSVVKARQLLIGTQYFKDAFITSQGERHDKNKTILAETNFCKEHNRKKSAK